nr:hypothetical protein [Tanacetum cinerariifolium]
MMALDIRVMLLVMEEIMQEDDQGWLNVTIFKVKVPWLGNALSQKGIRTLHGLRKRLYVILEVPHFEPSHNDLDNQNFGKRFVPQQELSDEQAFWLQTSSPNTDQSASSPVKIEASKELPK